MNSLHVEFDLPTSLMSQAGLDTEKPTEEIRRMLALFLYEHRRLSLGKACELGNMSYWDFADLNARLGISIHYGEEDRAEDRERLADV